SELVAVSVGRAVPSGASGGSVRRTSGNFPSLCSGLRRKSLKLSMKGNILLVDDAADIRELLGAVLRETYQVTEADSGASLKQLFSKAQPDVILLDIKLPDADGLDLLPQIKKQWPESEVIVLTGNATFDAAVEATKRGAYHFLNKPFDTQGLLVTVERALEHKQQNEENSTLRRAISTMSGGTAPVFQSGSMQTVVRTVERVAPSDVS